MNRPHRVLGWIAAFLAAVLLLCAVLYRPLLDAFLANPPFNATILVVLAVGVGLNIRQVLRLGPDAAWAESIRYGELQGTQQMQIPKPPRGSRLMPLARAAGERWHHGAPRLSTLTMRTVLDGIRSRLDEERDISRYLVGLLIFLGLLGTFWGLLDTLNAVGAVISGLSLGGEIASVFEELRAGLAAPLDGMGTAFSSSLFGLAGALVLGFVDLQAGHAQNRFYNDIEEWLAGGARGSGGLAEGADAAMPAYIEALLEQTSESLDKLQRTLAQQAEERRSADSAVQQLSTQVRELAERLRGEEHAAAHLRSIDHTLQQVSERLNAQHGHIQDDLRSELRLLARTLAGGQRSGEKRGD